MTKKRILAVIDIIGLLLVTFVIYKFMLPFEKICTFITDDLLSPFYTPDFSMSNDNIFSVFLTSNHNSWVMSLFHTMTVRILPDIFNIHPQIFVQTVWFPFSCFIFTLYLYCVSNNFVKYSKVKHLTWLWALFLFPLIIVTLRLIDFLWLYTQCCWVYAYVFMSLFGIVAFLELQSLYIQNEKFSKKRMIEYLLLIFLLGNTFETYKIGFCLTLVIGVILHKIFSKEPLINKKSLAFIAYSLVACLSTVLVPKVSIIYDNDYVKTFNLQNFITAFPGYIAEFCNNIIPNNLLLISLIAVLLFLIKIFGYDKLKNKRLFIYVFSSLLSILLLNFVYICVSNIDYFTSISHHPGLMFTNFTFLLCLLLTCIGYFISNTECKKPVLISIIFVLVLYSVNIVIYHKKYNDTIQEYLSSFKQIRQCHYVLEKFFVLNSLKQPVFYNYYTDGLFQNLSIRYFTTTYHAPFIPENYKIICITDKDYIEPNKSHFTSIRDLMIKKCKEVTGYQITEEELEKSDFKSLYKYLLK